MCLAKDLASECGSSFSPNSSVLVVVYDYFFGEGTKDFASLLKILSLDEEDYESLSHVERDAYYKISSHIISPQIQLQIILTLIRSVAYLHDNNVAHMDLKPANIVVNINTGRIQLIDFGVSCMESNCLPFGTTLYMAPEVIRSVGKRKPKGIAIVQKLMLGSTSGGEDRKVVPMASAMLADAWSMGVILFEYIHGQMPHDFPMDALFYHLGQAKQEHIFQTNFDHPNADVARAVGTVIDGFLQVDPNLRLSVVEAKDILQPLIDISLSPAPHSPMSPSPLSPRASPLSPFE